MSSHISIGTSGLLAMQQALTTVGHNIANAATPGYARRHVQLSGRGLKLVGGPAAAGGVSVEAVLRRKDMFLAGRLENYMASHTREEVQSNYFMEIEGLLQEPSAEGISIQIERFFNHWQALASRPEDATERITLLLNADQLAQRISGLRADLMNLRNAIHLEIGDSAAQVNVLAEKLAENNQLMKDSGETANIPLTLCDDRDMLMRQLAELIGARNTTPNELPATVNVDSLLLVAGPDHLDLVPPLDYNSPITVGSGQNASTVIPSSGKIGGLLDLNLNVLPELVNRLDQLAVDVMRSVNKVHAEGLKQNERYSDLTSHIPVRDIDGDGDRSNDILSNAGLPFAPAGGDLIIHVVDDATGAITTETVTIAPATQSLADLANAINALSHITASVSADGKLRIVAAAGYSFDFCADQETDILAALGINAFFAGESASNIRVVDDLMEHPGLLAAAHSLNAGDGSNASAISELRTAKVASDNTMTLADCWNSYVTDIGNSSASAQRSTEMLESMVTIINQQEQSVSGVSLDEEATKLLEYHQLYTACAHYLRVVSKLLDSLLGFI